MSESLFRAPYPKGRLLRLWLWLIYWLIWRPLTCIVPTRWFYTDDCRRDVWVFVNAAAYGNRERATGGLP